MINEYYLFSIAKNSLLNFLIKKGEIASIIDESLFMLEKNTTIETIHLGTIRNEKVYYGKGKKHYYTVSTSAAKLNGSQLRHKLAYLTFTSGHLIKVSYDNL